MLVFFFFMLVAFYQALGLFVFNLGISDLSVIGIIYALKDVFLLLIFLGAFAFDLLRDRLHHNQVFIFTAFVLGCVALMMVDVYDDATFTNIRRCLLFLLLFLSGLIFRRLRSVKAENVSRSLEVTLVIYAGIAIIEIFFGEKYFNLISIIDYKALLGWDYEGFEYGHFRSSDFSVFGTQSVPRLLSIFLEPTFGSAFLATCFIWFSALKRKLLYAYMCLFLGLLTFSKYFLVGVAIYSFFRVFPRASAFWVCLIGCSLVYILGAVTFDIRSYGALSHARGLYTGVNIMIANPLGLGLGGAGNMPRDVIPEIVNGEFGGESAMGNILAQLGLLGWVPYLIVMIWVRRIDKKLLRESEIKCTARGQLFVAKMLIVCGVFGHLASASALSFVFNFFTFFIAGLLVARSYSDDSHMKEVW